MSKSVDYKTAPIGTVAAGEDTTLVKNDKGWYWLEKRLQEGDGHMVPRYGIHRFELGEVITPETLAWLPPGSVIAPKREDHAMVRNDDGGWGWADGNPGVEPTKLVARWVAGLPYKLTEFPGLEVEDPYAVGETLEGEDAYENAPVGTVAESGISFTRLFKAADNGWKRLDEPQKPFSGVPFSKRTIVDHLAPWEVDLLVATPVVDPRQTGTVSLNYTYNPEKGTVYTHPHRDFGHVVKLPSGRYMAVPVRAVRDFATEQEAVEWLI